MLSGTKSECISRSEQKLKTAADQPTVALKSRKRENQGTGVFSMRVIFPISIAREVLF